jgi:biopolymer transport protein ExbD
MRIPSLTAKRRARIEIVPLIDIVFFLLATFVMVSMSMVKNQGIPVNLPVAATSAPSERKEAVMLTVTAGNELYYNKERIPLEQLPARLRVLKASSDPSILINGDETALLGSAVAVLDEVRKSGIRKVSIQTKGKRA